MEQGTKFGGRIVKAETGFSTKVIRTGRRGGTLTVPVLEHYAVIELKDEKGEKITFTTPKLTESIENLSSKEVTVYKYNDKYYVPDFGFFYR